MYSRILILLFACLSLAIAEEAKCALPGDSCARLPCCITDDKPYHCNANKVCEEQKCLVLKQICDSSAIPCCPGTVCAPFKNSFFSTCVSNEKPVGNCIPEYVACDDSTLSCCPGLTFQKVRDSFFNTCRMLKAPEVEKKCIAEFAACDDSDEPCCAGLTCQKVRSSFFSTCRKPKVPEVEQKCNGVDMDCDSGEQCCPGLTCQRLGDSFLYTCKA